MEPTGSLPGLHDPTTCPCPVADQSCPSPPPIPFFKIDFGTVLQSMPRTRFLRFPHKNLLRTSSPPPYILYAPPITFVFT